MILFKRLTCFLSAPNRKGRGGKKNSTKICIFESSCEYEGFRIEGIEAFFFPPQTSISTSEFLPIMVGILVRRDSTVGMKS